MIRLCPNCLKEMVCESIGWKCTGCRGFVDMQGNFHEYKEKPFMPPQTNADRIRAMSDEELAKKLNLFNNLEEVVPFCRNLPECDELLNTETGIPLSKCQGCLLGWLKQPAEE